MTAFGYNVFRIYTFQANHISKSEKSEVSDDQRAGFVSMVQEYHSIGKQVWYAKMGNENKQGVIGVKEGHEIIKKLQLKSYEGGKKILIVNGEPSFIQTFSIFLASSNASG